MRKIYSQIMLGIVCCILGFMLAHQFKELSGKGNQVITQATASGYNDLASDNEQLKNVKDQLEKENNQVLDELKKYETQATNKDEKTKDIKLQLDDSRVLLGLKDVEGQGITIYITPKSSIFSNNARQYLNYREMVYLINELHSAGAEAIAVNDNRIVSQSFINTSTNSETLIINDDKISPKNRIVIKAIGDKNILEEHITFPMLLDFEGLVNYDIKIEKSDSMKIPKYNKTYNDNYLK